MKNTAKEKKPVVKEKTDVKTQKAPVKAETKAADKPKNPVVKKLSTAQMAAQAVEKNKEQARVREQEEHGCKIEERPAHGLF